MTRDSSQVLPLSSSLVRPFSIARLLRRNHSKVVMRRAAAAFMTVCFIAPPLISAASAESGTVSVLSDPGPAATQVVLNASHDVQGAMRMLRGMRHVTEIQIQRVPHTAPPAGMRMAIPHMLTSPILPRNAPPDPRAMGAPVKNVSGYAAPAATTPLSKALKSSTMTGPSRGASPQVVNLGTLANTGITPWWSFLKGAIFGVGGFAVNLKTGNTLVSATDMAVRYKGLPFAFTRTYNSLSNHNYANTDGSTPSNYGEQWTNTFDAHIAMNSGGGLSVYDAAGTRYDYTSNGSGGWVPPAGIDASLTSDGGGNYLWTQHDGSVVYFNNPTQPSATAGLSGRMYQIWGRNHKNTLNFGFTWDSGDASSSSKLNTITVTADDGMTATLSFADFAATGGGFHRLLSTLAWPDRTIVTYHYDGLANLTQVDEPGNNVATTLKQAYTYTNASYLNDVLGPRYYQIGGQGGYFFAGYMSTTSGKATMLCYHGYINPSIPDGYSTGALQPSMPTGFSDWEDVNLNYGVTVPNATTVTNTFGAKSVYAWDASNDRIDSVQTYKSSTAYLTASINWNANNLPISVTDPRGNTTNMQYDPTGNVVAIGQPQVTSGGASFRPTSYISYDASNNAVASCDPVWSHAAGKDWTTTPASSDTLCPTADTGATRISYTPTADEPYGEMTQIQRPATPASSAGFKAVIRYDAASQGGTDHGLPTSVTGDQFMQSDGTNNTPSSTMQYDAHGNIVCKNAGNGWAIAQYDTLNRPTAVADADDSTLTGCGKTGGRYTGVNYVYYYPNGQVRLTETPAQHAAAKGVSYAYDADGNVASVVHHHSNVAGTTSYYYDGGNRLVEVKSPKDTNDYYPFPSMRRYYYDISDGGTVSIGSASNLKAYGNHFLTQEYLAAATQSSPTPSGTAAWTSISGKSYDMLNRPISDFNLSASNVPRATRNYDASGQAGLLSSVSDGLGQQTTLAYDARSVTNVSFSGDGGVTPARTYSHDPDGRVSAITSTGVGTQGYTYDKAGELTQSVEPSGTGITSPGTLSYTYYPNGARQAISVSSSGLTKNNLMTYSYRADGLPQTKKVGLVTTNPFTWTYTNGGRMLSRNDPYTASVISNATSPYSGSYTLAPTTKVYDTYGRLSSQKIPMTGQYTNIGYDLEGNVDTYNGLYAPGDITGNYGSKQVNYGLNVRGELVALHHYTVGGNGLYDVTWPHYVNKSANGFLYPVAESGSAAPPTTKFDALDGAVLKKTQTASTKTYSWDTIGRQTRADLVFGTSSGNYTRTYDAEHHLLTHPYSTFDTPSNRPDCSGNDTDDGAYTGTQTYKWGPNGHPLQMNGETLHWDGNQLLYTSNSSGTVDNVKAGKLADINPSTSKMIVLDRDLSGVVVSTHNNEGFSGWSPPDPYGQRCVAGPPPSSSAYASAYVTTPFAKIAEPASDAITDGNNAIQGVRVYDSKTGQWATPDAAGSAKPYTWNANNPLLVQDPSGLTPVLLDSGNGPGLQRVNWGDYSIYNAGVYEGTTWAVDHAITHGFVQVNYGTNGKHNVFEAGPQFNVSLTVPPQTLVPQPSYQSVIGPGNAFTPTQLLPPVGVSESVWAFVAADVFQQINAYLASNNIPYPAFTSNSYIATGLQALGYSSDQIQQIMGSRAFGSQNTLGNIVGSVQPANPVILDNGLSLSFAAGAAQADAFMNQGQEMLL